MARREKQPVHKVVMTEGKRSIVRQLLEEYDIQTAQDIQEALKDLLGSTIKEMMEAEMDGHLGYGKSERSDSDDYRNGYKPKRVNSSFGSMEIQVPQDRKSTFEPQVVKKRQKDISSIDQKIISMYAKGMTTRQISDTLMDIYGFEASEGFISDVTDKILPQIEDWQNRPLEDVYPVVYIDAIHYSVREDGVIRKLAAYVILGLTLEGRKEVLSIQVGENESSKYWLSVLNGLKNRGVKDILVLCSDGLTGIKEAIRHVRGGHPLGIFPSGAVSDLSIRDRCVRDREWQEPIIQLIRKLRVPVIPVRFLDRNSDFYYSLGLIDWRVRLLRLPSEVFNKRGKPVRLVIGDPIPCEVQDSFHDTAGFSRFLRGKVYDPDMEKL